MAAMSVVLQFPQRNKQKLWVGKAAGTWHRNYAAVLGLSQGQHDQGRKTSQQQSQGRNLGPPALTTRPRSSPS